MSSASVNEVRLGQDSLRVMADETGGFAVVNNNDFNGTFRRIVDDNSSYYVLGYYPTNDKRDGRFRKIEVKLANRPGLTVSRAPRLRGAARQGAGDQAGRPERRRRRSCGRR